ncbi:MAG: diguanylate cyclase [Planctomycetes bacterium]|nr:diguanylate cyclase [Planctomycetota bacterium]
MKPYCLIAQTDLRLAARCRRVAASEWLEPICTRDGAGALRLLKERGAPLVLIADVSLPRVDGLALVREFRRIAGGAPAPALVTAASAGLRSAVREHAGELGVTAVFPWSAPIAQFTEAISRAMDGASAGPGEEPARLAEESTRRERQRLIRVERLGLAGGLPHDELLEPLVAEAMKAFGAAMGMVSVPLQDSVWFRAQRGMEAAMEESREAMRSWPFCREVVEGGEPLVVPDAAAHPLFARHALVTEGHVRGYAGVPVVAASGEVLGALAIADTKPLEIGPEELDVLAGLARRAAGELEARRSAGDAIAGADQLGAALGADGESQEGVMATLATLQASVAGLDTGLIFFDSSRRIVHTNEAAEEMLGIGASSLRSMTRDELLAHTAALAAEPDDFLRRVRAPEGGPFTECAELELARPRRRVLRWSGRPLELPSGLGHLTALTEMTAESELAEERESRAVTDPLTGLLNRRGGIETIRREVALATRAGEPVSFVLFEVEGLKRLNMDLGHAAGDRVLREAAASLTQEARACDLVARWAGTAFLSVLPCCGIDGAHAYAERAAHREPLDGPEDGPPVAIAAAAVELRKDETWEQALARAEAQLAVARAPGNRAAG